MSEEEKLQSLIVELKTLESYLNEVNARQSTLANAIVESGAAREALRNLPEAGESELLVPIGGGLFINSLTPPPEKLIVSIGANVAVEKTNKEATEFIENRLRDLEKAVATLESQKNNLRSKMNSTNATIRSMIEKQRKG